MDNGAKGAVWAGLEIAKVGNTTLSSCTGWSGVATLGSCTDELGTAGCATLGSIRGASTSGGEVATGEREGQGSAEPVCREARASRSWTRVGGMKLPVRLNCFIAREKSLIAAMSISVAVGDGGVTAVSGNHATVSVTRGEDVAVTKT